jgi:Raf kinase inhibitor-like YbhB/YbcL family protein
MKKIWLLIPFIILIAVIFIFIKPFQSLIINQQISNMKLTSPSFINDQKLPAKYTCQGEGSSPPLEIAEVPEDTQSLALILKDPDAPLNTFIHWLVWNIAPNTTTIPENTLPEGSVLGINSIGKNFYFAPCPPQGQHHYIFYLYAIDTTLTLPPEAGSKDLEQIIAGHILGATTLTGIFP